MTAKPELKGKCQFEGIDIPKNDYNKSLCQAEHS